jgi:hypothetical protein
MEINSAFKGFDVLEFEFLQCEILHLERGCRMGGPRFDSQQREKCAVVEGS